MPKLKPRSDLPQEVAKEFADLGVHFTAPAIILRLKNGILTRAELRSIEDAGIGSSAPISPLGILEVVARQRQLTLERALLKLARSFDIDCRGPL